MGGASAGAGAGPLSLIGVGLSAFGQYRAGQGQQEADEYKAESLERAAEVGKVQAVQTSADLTRKMVDTLGNIDAIRAAAHDDPSSPTGAAVRDYQETLGITKRTTAVDNILEQSSQDTADAGYLRTAGKYALLGGELGAAGTIGSSLGKTDFSKFGIG
jgi:hypothetical protein